jgi:uncharacterized protein (DUF1330 family)
MIPGDGNMTAYLIADIRVRDTERYQDYVANVLALVEKHGGRYRVRGGAVDVLEGSWSPGRLVILEFPDRAAALGFYSDPAYAPLKKLRQTIAASAVALVEGWDG